MVNSFLYITVGFSVKSCLRSPLHLEISSFPTGRTLAGVLLLVHSWTVLLCCVHALQMTNLSPIICNAPVC